MAKKLLVKKMPLETIADITELSIDEVKAIKNEKKSHDFYNFSRKETNENRRLPRKCD